MAPILPGISDSPEQLDEVVARRREAGATGIWANVLYLKPGTREHFLEALARDWPEQLDRYERALRARAYLPQAEVEPVRRSRRARAKHGSRPRRCAEPPPAAEQLALCP
jgi:DNA repair photolyase